MWSDEHGRSSNSRANVLPSKLRNKADQQRIKFRSRIQKCLQPLIVASTRPSLPGYGFQMSEKGFQFLIIQFLDKHLYYVVAHMNLSSHSDTRREISNLPRENWCGFPREFVQPRGNPYGNLNLSGENFRGFPHEYTWKFEAFHVEIYVNVYKHVEVHLEIWKLPHGNLSNHVKIHMEI